MQKNLTNTLLAVTGLCIAFFAPGFLKSSYWVTVLILTAINVLLTSSLRTISLLGHISLGHVGYMLIGAYTSALLTMKGGIPFWIAIVLAGLLCALIALLLGYPFLKIKGVTFAVLTFLTAEIFRLIVWNWRSVTGGNLGLLGIPSPEPLPVPWIGPIGFENINNYYYLTLCIVLLSLYAMYRLENSRVGLIWGAIRDADNLSQTVGINVIGYKMVNFAIACFFAGVAGSLFAHFQHGLGPDPTSRFGVTMSLYLLLYMVVGGVGHFAGPIVGAIALTLTSEFARPLKEYEPMMIGGISIVVVFFLSDGLIVLPGKVATGIKWLFSVFQGSRKQEKRMSLSKEGADLK